MKTEDYVRDFMADFNKEGHEKITLMLIADKAVDDKAGGLHGSHGDLVSLLGEVMYSDANLRDVVFDAVEQYMDAVRGEHEEQKKARLN